LDTPPCTPPTPKGKDIEDRGDQGAGNRVTEEIVFRGGYYEAAPGGRGEGRENGEGVEMTGMVGGQEEGSRDVVEHVCPVDGEGKKQPESR